MVKITALLIRLLFIFAPNLTQWSSLLIAKFTIFDITLCIYKEKGYKTLNGIPYKKQILDWTGVKIRGQNFFW